MRAAATGGDGPSVRKVLKVKHSSLSIELRSHRGAVILEGHLMSFFRWQMWQLA